MVHSGIVRAFGSDLRRFLGMALRNRFAAFTGRDLRHGASAEQYRDRPDDRLLRHRRHGRLVPALAIMLGANVGTTLIVQVLSFNVSAFAPLLFLVGVITFKRGRTNTHARSRAGSDRRGHHGAVAAHLARHAGARGERAGGPHPARRDDGEPLLCLLIAAALTWAAHSSVTVVLLVMSLAYSHFITPVAALALILGANLGSAINPLLEGSRGDNPASRRLPLGNLLNRVVGCALALPFLNPIAEGLARLEPNPSRMAADFHTAFNLALALLFILPLKRLAIRLDPASPGAREARRSIDPSVSRRHCARDAFRGARLRGSRDAAHRRHRRGHASPDDDGTDDR